ncbi:MAG: bifunctional molybdenum cofactor biosynthesis protein MoaC/MoaB [Gammaproteobacteria bacterium]|jgi:molybdenum cofactor biosynthesis protein MoaC
MTNTHFQMIDVGEKPATHRIAIAQGCIHVGEKTFALIANRKLPKGDALILAEMAGIQGAKLTAQLIPLCHPLGLDQVSIHTHLDPENAAIYVYCRVSAVAKTGVEMESLAGVNAALLCIYDLAKMIEPALKIDNIRLLLKIGGKNGVWTHPEGIPSHIEHLLPTTKKQPNYKGVKVTVIKTSDRASNQQYDDVDELKQSLVSKLTSLGMNMIEYKILPNNPLELKDYLVTHIESQSPDLIITLGGTGLSKRDTTPETIAQLCDKQIPGISELLRHEGAQFNRYAWLSRSIAGIIQNTLVITLPGKPKAAHEGLNILEKILDHVFISIKSHTKEHQQEVESCQQ